MSSIDDFFGEGESFYPDIRLEGIEEFYPDIDAITEEAELMGIDLDDPELLGGFIKKLIKRIKKKVNARKKGGKARGSYSISTPKGAVSISESGLSLTRPYPEAGAMVTESYPVTKKAGLLEQIQANPMLMIIPVAAIMFLLTQKKK